MLNGIRFKFDRGIFYTSVFALVVLASASAVGGSPTQRVSPPAGVHPTNERHEPIKNIVIVHDKTVAQGYVDFINRLIDKYKKDPHATSQPKGKHP